MVKSARARFRKSALIKITRIQFELEKLGRLAHTRYEPPATDVKAMFDFIQLRLDDTKEQFKKAHPTLEF